MMIISRSLCAVFLLSGLCSCGTSPTLQLNLTSSTAFSDTNVKDIVFVIQNIPTNGNGLDQNQDGQPDTFVYPDTCGASQPTGCGFAPQHGTFTVGDLPLNFQYSVTVKLRSSTGTTLHSGTATFNNVKNAPAVSLAVN